MTLSLIIVILLPLFLLPAFLMSTNRVRIYFYCSLISTVAVLILALSTIIATDTFNEIMLASPFLNLFSFIRENHPEMSIDEESHIISMFIYLTLYLLVYLISYMFIKIFYIGKNPDIHKPSRFITKIAYGIGFFLLTYLPLSLFLINIRLLFPFSDGFLSGLFDLIYQLRA